MMFMASFKEIMSNIKKESTFTCLIDNFKEIMSYIKQANTFTCIIDKFKKIMSNIKQKNNSLQHIHIRFSKRLGFRDSETNNFKKLLNQNTINHNLKP